MSWLWIFKLVWNKSPNSSNFSDLPLKVGFSVVRDLGKFKILLMFLLKLAELLSVANCWKANKIWCASTVEAVFSLRNCGWFVERAGEQYRTSSWNLVTKWCVFSWSESFRLLVWQAENTTSGQGSIEERSPLGSRYSELLFLDVSGTATEQVRTCWFRRNLSSLDKAPKMRDFVRLHSWESFLVTLP